MQFIHSTVVALSLIATVAAQDDAPTTKPATPKERYEALEREADEAYKAWVTDIRAKIQKAKDAGEPMPAIDMSESVKPFLDRAKAAATEYKGTEDAVQFLVWIAMNGARADRAAGINAIETLLSDHVKSEGLAPLGPMMGQLEYIIRDADKRTKILASIEKDSPVASLRGWAMLSRLGNTLDSADLDSDEYKNAKKNLIATAKEANDSQLMGEIEGKISMREKFGIGLTAPDIEGHDLDEVAFKMSDYKGKIIFLDFWGDW